MSVRKSPEDHAAGPRQAIGTASDHSRSLRDKALGRAMRRETRALSGGLPFPPLGRANRADRLGPYIAIIECPLAGQESFMSRTSSTSIRSLLLVTSAVVGIAACDPQGPVQPTTPTTSAPTGASAIKIKPTFYFNGILFTGQQDAASGELYSMNPDGSGVFRLTQDDSTDLYPDLSPKGPSFIWIRRANGSLVSEIYSQNLDGTKRKRLTSLGTSTTYPRYSPDGSKIAFAATIPGVGSEIFVMNANGTGITRLTWSGRKATAPSWSPDGSKIAYQANDNMGAPGVWVMRASGDQQTLVAACAWPGCTHPRWSPVANEIAFDHVDFSGIVVVDATTGAQTAYIPGSDHDIEPTWSKDGTKIIFASQRSQNGGLDLYSTVPVRGGVTAPPPVVRLTSFPGNEMTPAYSR
jgi:TolB protein